MGKGVSAVVALFAVALAVALAVAPLACGRQELLKADTQADGSVPSDGPITPEAACADAGSTDAGAPAAIPLGVYTACSSRVVKAGSTAEGAGGTISLTATGGVLTVEVRKGLLAFGTGTLAFTPITASTAVAVPDQMYRVSNVPCMISTVAFGALALEGDKLAMTLVGQGCGDAISGTLRCTVPVGVTDTLAAPPNPCSPAGPPACGCTPPAFAVGTYGQCTTSVPGFGGGTVTVAQSQGVVTAALDGLTSIAPMNATLRFTPTTKTTATIEPGQTWVVSAPGAFSPTVPDTLMIKSGTMVVDRSMLFAFVSGTDAVNTDLRESFHCSAGN